MASVTPPEKVGLVVDTNRLVQKPSQDTLSSDMMTPSAEKAPVLPQTSNISTPATLHQLNPFDTDIEAIITTTDTRNRGSAECTKGGPDCQVWPGRDHWRRKAKANKMSRHNWNCLANMSKRNRIIVKILIGVLIVGIAVAVGLGISKPLGAGIWRSETQNS